MGEGNGRFKSSQGKSSVDVLGVFYRLLPMGRKDATFGLKYPKVLISTRIRHYEEMFVEPPIYIRYVALTILICFSMLLIELFYRTQPSLSAYLYFSIYRFVTYP